VKALLQEYCQYFGHARKILRGRAQQNNNPF
jgi:hypothetical protein